MGQNYQIIVDKEVGEVLQQNIRNHLTVISASLLSFERQREKETCRIKAQLDKIEELMKRLTF